MPLLQSLGFLGDIVAQHAFSDDVPLPQRRAWVFPSDSFAVVDDPDLEALVFTVITDPALHGPLVAMANADGSLDVSDGKNRVMSVMSADRVWTFTSTHAAAGDVVRVQMAALTSHTLTIKSQAGATLWVFDALAETDAEFRYSGTQWEFYHGTSYAGAFIPSTRLYIAGAGLTGGGDGTADRTFNVVANADGSIVVHADDIQVGVLATDAQHGNRGGGGIHSNAVSGGAAGFLTGTDKAAIDDLSSATTTKVNGATLTPSVGGGVINACTGAGAVTPAASSWIGKQVSIVLDGVASSVITSADGSDRFYTGSGAAATSYTCNGSSVLIYRGANKILAYP